jgi:thioesterase domain-containing protein
VRVNDAPAHQPEPTPAEPLPPGVEALSPGGWKTPLVLLPAGHGRPSSYYFLAEQWDPERPLYVLVPPGVNPDEVPIQNPTELLTHYLTTLRCLRRHGPYMLAGVCAGGLLSLEIARMLREREQTVAFVGLIETYRVPSMAYAFPRRTFMHVRKMMKMPPGMWPPYLRKLSKAFHYRLSVKLGGKPASPEPGRTALHQANNRICEQLRPKPWPGQIHYFLTRHAWAQLRKTPLVVWDDIALGGVERSFISGHHEDCLNAEYLPEWIDHFLALLDRADPACRPKIRQK